MTNGMNMFLIHCWIMKKCKILWDFSIQTNKVIEHRRPDVVCIGKIAKSCLIIDIAIPGDQNIIVKEQEMIDKYQDLRTELGKLWKLKTEVVHMMVSALGTISHNLKFYLRNVGISIVASSLQKAAILGTAFILTRVPGISEFR